MHLMPPPVDPAEPPMNMHRTRIHLGQRGPQFKISRGIAGGGEDGGHLNTAYWRDWPGESYTALHMLSAVMRVKNQKQAR
jgi:hypothetical protein